MIAYLKLLRLYYSGPLACGIGVICYFLSPQFAAQNTLLIAKAILSLWLVLGGAYILNDICDSESDKINSPKRPLACGSANRTKAAQACIALFFSGIIVSFFCNKTFSLILIAVAIGLIFYDIYSKRLSIFKNILAALLTTSLYPLSFAIAGNHIYQSTQIILAYPLWLFLITLSYQILKDIRDIKGDSLHAATTRAFFHSENRLLISARALNILASLIVLLPGYLLETIYWISACAAVVLAVLVLFVKWPTAIILTYSQVIIITIGSFVAVLLA